MPEAAGQILDRELALSRVGGDAELWRELADLFLQEYPRIMSDLGAALERGDAYAVERAAHGLKGSAASIGGVSSADLARHIEMLGRARKLDEVRHTIQLLELSLVALRTELGTL